MVKAWHRLLLLFLLSILAVSTGTTAAAAPPEGRGALPADLEPLIDQFFAEKMAEHHVPGAVFALVRDGKVYSKAYGYANLEQTIPADPEETLFRIASVTKIFSTIAILQLTEEGKVDLEADVNTYLRAFQVQNRFDRPLRVADLLVHTDGFEERILRVLSMEPRSIPPLETLLKEDLPPLIAEPGTMITYGSWGSAVASYIVEQVSGLPFEQYVSERILRPLGISRSTLVQSLPGEVQARLATVYQYEDGQFQPSPFIAVTTPASGGGSATGAEMGRLLLALLQGGEPILQRQSMALMMSRQFSAHAELPGVTMGFFEHVEAGQRALLREGSGVGVNSRILLLPEAQTAFFVAANTKGGEMNVELTSFLLGQLFPAGAGERPQAVPEVDPKRFEGQYRYAQFSRHTLGKVSWLLAGRVAVTAGTDGILTVTPQGMGDPYGGFEEAPSRWVPAGNLLFQRTDGKAFIAFGADTAGRITHLYSGMGYHSAFERLSWYQTPAFHLAIAGLLLVVALSGVGVAFAKSLSTGARILAPVTGLLAAVTLVGALPVAMNAGKVGGFPRLAFAGEMPPLISAILALPYVVAGLSLCLTGLGIMLWLKGRGSLAARWWYTLVMVGVCGLTGYMAYWNLL